MKDLGNLLDKLIARLETQFAVARSLERVKVIRADAEAARGRVRDARLGIEFENRAAELRVCAERKLGQLLMAQFSHGGDHRPDGRRKRLAQLGINYSQSARWRRMAAVPEERFESYLRDAKARGCRICTADVLKLEK